MPLAVVADVGTMTPNLYFVHADHLNRPFMMTDGSKNVVWSATYWPFGEVSSITGSASNNLRFPGQYFQIEPGLHYNWYRHYDPTLGRYTQPDPLGFVDGPSIYAYAELSPIMYTDRFGLTLTVGIDNNPSSSCLQSMPSYPEARAPAVSIQVGETEAHLQLAQATFKHGGRHVPSMIVPGLEDSIINALPPTLPLGIGGTGILHYGGTAYQFRYFGLGNGISVGTYFPLKYG
ncbi:MAG: hypothetical protein GC182_20845 [Rhodopseudomonas sp.]|nr:hypothetical protein [Rhodopseudomonas sp.]